MKNRLNDFLLRQDTKALARNADPAIYRRLCAGLLAAYDVIRCEGAAASPATMTAMLDRLTPVRRAQLLLPRVFCRRAWAALREDLDPRVLARLAGHVCADMERLYRDEERTVGNLRDLVTRAILLMVHMRAEKGLLGCRFNGDWRLARRRRAFASARLQAIWDEAHPKPQVVREVHAPVVHQHVHVAPVPSGRW